MRTNRVVFPLDYLPQREQQLRLLTHCFVYSRAMRATRVA